MDTQPFFTVPLRVVYSSSAALPAGPVDVQSLLDCGDEPLRFIVQNSHGSLAFIFIFPMELVKGLSEAWRTDEAAAYLEKALEKKIIKDVSFSVKPASTPKSELQAPALVVLLPFDSAASGSVPLSFEEQENIAVAKEQQRGRQSRWTRFATRNPAAALVTRILALTAIILVAMYAVQAIFFPSEGVWMRYDTSGSQGPRFQLQFDHKNVSDWATTHAHEPGRWFLRIDDQAMIPSELVDEEELQYQRWYQQRYPEMDQIRLEETYLSEDFLQDPYAIQVPADRAFHMSHCVRAVRRYWQARETGHHVCPRDIDYRHMKHCLDALDEWAFPSGPRGSVGGMQHSGHHHKRHEGEDDDDDDRNAIIDENDHTYLIWKTKVCFD